MAQSEFLAGLQAAGYGATEVAPGRVVFGYTIESGKFAGRQIRLGFDVPADFRLTPPSGPHISPRLLPNRSGGMHPEGGQIDVDECDDLLFVIGKLTTVNPHFDALRAGIQALIGMLAGVAADGVLSPLEIQRMTDWIAEWPHLKGLWPFDECDAILTTILADGKVTAEEAQYFIALADDLPLAGHPTIDITRPLRGGICAADPQITFPDKRFVFTGESRRCENRAVMETRVIVEGGIPLPRLTREADYLVVCDAGSPHWAYACYGRKVEKAYHMRRDGHGITLVHEIDFWDALGGAPALS